MNLKPTARLIELYDSVSRKTFHFSNPNVEDGSLPHWPKFDKDSKEYMEFGEASHSRKGFMKGRYELWMKTSAV